MLISFLGRCVTHIRIGHEGDAELSYKSFLESVIAFQTLQWILFEFKETKQYFLGAALDLHH